MDSKIEQIKNQVVISPQDVANKIEQMTGRKLSAVEIGIVELVLISQNALQQVIQEKQNISSLLKSAGLNKF